MRLTEAVSGFVVFLLSVSAVQEQQVTYSHTEICALKGSTVDITCTFTYPSRVNNYNTEVKETFWLGVGELKNWRIDSENSGRVRYRCDKNNCILKITDVTEGDSAEYKFSFSTNTGNYTGSPGVTLSVADLQVQVSRLDVSGASNGADLKCHSSCLLPANAAYIWYKNGQKIEGQSSSSHRAVGYISKNYSCAVKGHEGFPSPPVSIHAPKSPSVSVTPSGEIVEGTSVNLTCRSDANPAAKYTWYKKNRNPDLQPLSKEPQFVIRSVQSSDSGEYYCTAENELGRRRSGYISIDVKYGPKLASVSVSPSGEIVEGTSVNLTCSSDANPAASYTWYKENQTLFQGPEGIYSFTSISSEDRGIYHCRSENQHGQVMSSSVSVDVQYAPKLPSVSVSPSAKIVEGTSVNLTCSSDANPAANYTWYKEDEDSPKASGQIFTITDFGLEHSGNYYCEAWNGIGHHTFTVHLTVAAGPGTLEVVGIITGAVLLAVVSLSVFLWIRRKRASKESSEAKGRPDDRDVGQQEGQDELQYASIHFSNNKADCLYSNVRPAGPIRPVERQELVEYAPVRYNRAGAAPSHPNTGEAALYSTVNKT